MIPTNYTGSDGKVTPIAELNNFHLVNALLKTATQVVINNNAEDRELPALRDALKAEVLKRLNPEK